MIESATSASLTRRDGIFEGLRILTRPVNIYKNIQKSIFLIKMGKLKQKTIVLIKYSIRENKKNK